VSKLKDDSGVIAPLFAILLCGGVLFGLIALVVDGGQSQLQKHAVRQGAEAVAEALGQHCADEYSAVNCLTDSFTLRSQTSGAQVVGTATATNPEFLSALANPKGGPVSVTSVCGQSSAAPTMPSCETTAPPMVGCLTDPGAAGSNSWLRVYTEAVKTPTFLSSADTALGHAPLIYQGCAQVVWGKANAMPIYGVGTQLPLMIGLCDVRLGAPYVQAALTGNDASRAGCPSFRDRSGAAFSANAHGWFQFNPAAASNACWSIGQTGCATVPMPAGAADTARISVLAVAAAANLNRVSILPVFTYGSGGQPSVVSYVPFYLTGYRFFGSSGGVGCSGNLCVSGSFKTRVIQPYGQAQNLAVSSQAAVPNLGFQVLKKVP
jgi:Flp pilus assembly protein TadG